MAIEVGDEMDQSQWIRTRTPESRALFERVKVATRLSSELSAYGLDDAELIQTVFEELIGKPVGDTFTLIPPFCADHGLNITGGGPSSSGPAVRSPVTQPSTSPTRP